MSDEPNIDEYLTPAATPPTAPQTPAVVVTSGGKKRKKPASPPIAGVSELKQKARMLCGSPEQWRSVSRYPTSKLTEWVESKEFDRTSAFQESVFGFVHKTFALILDTVARGDGYVEEELLADQTLKSALIEEMYGLVGFLTNKYRIIALTTADCTHAKRRQWKEAPPPPVIIEEIQNDEPGGPREPEQEPSANGSNDQEQHTHDMDTVPDGSDTDQGQRIEV
jgi:hypothetical protein